MLAQTFGRLRAESDDRRAVRFERVYDYRPEEVWAAITEPEQIRGWLGEAELDLAEDGEGVVKFSEQEIAQLRVRRLEPGRLVEYDWTYPNEPVSVLRLELEPRGEGTLLTLDHRRLAEADVVEYGAGWHSHLDALELLLTGRSHDWQKRFDALETTYRASAHLVGKARLGVLRRDGERRGVRYERILAAAPSDVWAALIDPEQFRVWMGAETATLEPVVGGHVTLRWNERESMSGRVRVFDPPDALEYTWNEEAEGVVRWELSEVDGGTRLVLDHSALPAEETVGVGAGWHSHLDWLEAHLAGREFDFGPRWRELGPTYTDLAAAL